MNGAQPFIYIRTCGCVFSQAGLRAVSSTPPPRDESEKPEKGEEASTGKQLVLCPQCATKYDKTLDVIHLNPPPEEEEKMWEAMILRRASEPTKKSKKRKAATPPDATEHPSKAKKHASATPTVNSNIATASRAVAQSLAEEEAKRKAHMSDAVKSLYSSKDGPQRKETFMTMGTFTRVRLSHSLSNHQIFTHRFWVAVCMIYRGPHSARRGFVNIPILSCINIMYHNAILPSRRFPNAIRRNINQPNASVQHQLKMPCSHRSMTRSHLGYTVALWLSESSDFG